MEEKRKETLEMLRRGMTQKEVAQRVGVSQWRIWEWKKEERGNVKWPMRNAK